jgi:ribonucleoside-diphosphate reductase alpha chain
MQAAAQKWVDSSISKTINCPADISFGAFKDVYMAAWDQGCKGCTTYRPNAVTGSVLSVAETPEKTGAAERLAEARAAAGLSQADLAEASGLTAETLAALENGSQALSPEIAMRLAEPLGTTDAWLLLCETTQVPIDDTGATAEHPARDGDVIYMSDPLDRPQALEGNTYKVKWPGSEHALYITINDIVIGGRRRPFEVFINSKNMEHFAWTVALTRMISAVFRRGGDVSFVVEELKAVFDPRGGAWMQGKYVPSILAAIGGVIERHLIETGFIAGEGLGLKTDPKAALATVGGAPAVSCSSCGSFEMRMVEGCMTCANCGFSKCG